MTQMEALAWTLGVEVPIVVAIVAAARWAPGRLGLIALLSVAASCTTHPLLWLADGALQSSLSTPPRWALLESAVVLVESAFYAWPGGLGARQGFLLSLVANAASFGVGLLLYARA